MRKQKKGKMIGRAALCTAVLAAAFFCCRSILGRVQGESAAGGAEQPEQYMKKESIAERQETEETVQEVQGTFPEIAAGTSAVSLQDLPYAGSRYLLKELSGDLQTDFAELYRVVSCFENFCRLPVPVPKEDVALLMTLLHTECPELFQNDSAANYQMETSGGLVFSVTVPYSMGKAEYDAEYEKCMAVIGEIRKKAETCADDYEKELTVYREICGRCTYDREDPRSGDAAGVLLYGRGKCDGISLAYKWIMDELDIPCIVVSGESRKGEADGHAWNEVKSGEVWYAIDVTQDCDAGNRSILCYPVFHTSDKELREDYLVQKELEMLNVPECTSAEQSYHARNGSYIRSGEEKEGFFRGMTAAAKAGGAAPVQFETEEGWQLFQTESTAWASEWMEENGMYGSSSYRAMNAFRTAQICVELNENSARLREISESLAVCESQIEAAKKELTGRKESLDLIQAEIKDIQESAAELQAIDAETWTGEQFDEYNRLAERHNELQESYRQSAEEYNALAEEYRDLCDTANVLIEEYNALSGKV